MFAVIKYLVPLLLFTAHAWSANQRIAQHQGLDADNISAMMFDHQGFMWIGSQEGLFFYDGAQLEKFEPDVTDNGSIAALDIRNLYLSRDNSIWISTNSGGLSRFNPETHAFINYRHDSDDINSLSNDSVYDVVDGPDGHLWIATQIGLNRLQPASGDIKRFYKQDESVGALPANYVYKLFVDSQQRLWVGTLGGGLSYWAGEQRGFIPVPLPHGGVDVFSIVEQNGEHLWVGTRQGLFKVKLDDLTVSLVDLGLKHQKEPMIISLHLEDQLLLVGTYGLGLQFYDTKIGKLLGTTQHKTQHKETITAIVKNQSGQLFYATWGQGVHLLDNLPKTVDETAQINSFWHALPNVTAIQAQSESNKIWIGSFSEGLHWLDLTTDTLHKFTSTDSLQEIHDVLSIASAGNNELLVGTSNGLWHLSAQGQVTAFLDHAPNQSNTIGMGFVRVLEPDGKGNVWIGLGGSGLYKYELSNGQLTSYRHLAGQSASISDDYITALLVDGPHIWVGTRSNGLNRCLIATMSCQRFLVNNSGLTHYNISDIVKDQQGTVWVGTDGGGLHKVVDHHTQAGAAVNIISEPGLSAKSVKAILVQADNEIWFATNEGLFIFNTAEQNFHRANDPILTELGNFNQRARARTAEFGILGSNNGVFFAGLTGVESNIVFPIRFTQITSDYLPKPMLSSQLDDQYHLKVPWGGMLNVQFTLLDFSTAKHSYEYRLSSSEGWRKLHNVRQLNFYKMEPGTHTLEVRGKGSGDLWSEPSTLTISVIPPWWRNITYLLLLLLLAALLAVSYHKYRMAKWRKITHRLNTLKEEKLLIIEQLKQNERQLTSAFEGMRKLASKLQHAKEEERKSISRELHDQFGQSLTAIQIGLQLYRRQHPANSEQIDTSVSTIQAMIKQVRAFSFDLRPSLLDDVGLVAAINNLANKMSASLDYPILFSADDNFPETSPELTTTLFRVIQESLTNAVRHAKASQIKVTLSFDANKVTSVISDNGIGFDIGKIKNKIINGGHLGLLGAEERVRSQNGRLDIKSQPEGGVVITIEFPYEK